MIPVVMMKNTMTLLMIDSNDTGKDGDSGDGDDSNNTVILEG